MEKPRSSPSAALRAVLFDAYGTLFDVYSVGLLAEQLFPGQGQALGVMWRDKQIEYTRLVTTSSGGAHYQPFWELTRAGLRYACKRLGLNLTAEHEEQLMNQYRFWVNRYRLPFEELGTQPVYTGHDLRDLLALPGLPAASR